MTSRLPWLAFTLLIVVLGIYQAETVAIGDQTSPEIIQAPEQTLIQPFFSSDGSKQALGNSTSLPLLGKCKSCPVGWELFLGSCYKVHLELVPWFEARDGCMKEGAVLALAKNSQQLHYVFETLNKNIGSLSYKSTSYFFWIGASKNSSQEEFKYLDGSPFKSDNPLWCNSYPKNRTDWDCVEIGNERGACYTNYNCLSDVENGVNNVNNLYICQKGC